jgi:hypothetical protein
VEEEAKGFSSSSFKAFFSGGIRIKTLKEVRDRMDRYIVGI